MTRRLIAVVVVVATTGAARAKSDWKEFPGFAPLGDGDAAGDGDVKRLKAAPGDHLEELDCGAGNDAVLVAHGGGWTGIFSFADGLAVFDAGGKLVGRSAAVECQGSQAGLRKLAIGQVVSDPAPEVVLELDNGGRADSYTAVAVFKQSPKGTFEEVAEVSISYVTRNADAEQTGSIKLAAPDQLVVHQAGEKKTETLGWDPVAFKFRPGAKPAPALPAPSGPVGAPVITTVGATVTATSTFADKKDAYAAWRVLVPTRSWSEGDDGAPVSTFESAWCEGKPDEGLGEGITITLTRPTRIDDVFVLTGVQKNEKLFAANNQITSLVLTTSDGRKLAAAPSGKRDDATDLALGGAPVSSITVAIGAVAKGRMNDSCITQVELTAGGKRIDTLVGVDAAALAALPVAARALSEAIARCDAAAIGAGVDLPLVDSVREPAPGAQHTVVPRRIVSAKELCMAKVTLEDPGKPWSATSEGPGKVAYQIDQAGWTTWHLALRGGAWHLVSVETADD